MTKRKRLQLDVSSDLADDLEYLQRELGITGINDVLRECLEHTAMLVSLMAQGRRVFVGPEHAWASTRSDMSFWTLEEFSALWTDWNVLAMNEYKGPWPLVSGQEIFQHRIHLVAKKIA